MFVRSVHLLLLLGICIPFCVQAAQLSVRAQQCVQSAAQYHRVNPDVLTAIARVESSGNPEAVGRNSNGTLDVGLVQTNSIHFEELVKKGVAPSHLRDECVSLYVGAWMLSKKMAKHGNTWRAIGAYHSETLQHNYKYQQLIVRELVAMGVMRCGAVSGLGVSSTLQLGSSTRPIC